MCEHHVHHEGQVAAEQVIRHSRGVTRFISLPDLMAHARYVADEPELRRSATGFIGYGSTRPGDRVLVAVDNQYDPRVPEAIARALREKGAKVDVLVLDIGPDREFDEIDEIHVIMRREPYRHNPRRWDYVPWVTELGYTNKYDLVIHGKGSPIPKTPFRYEAIPWLQAEQLASKAAIFPRDVHTLINQKAWHVIWEEGRGGRVHLTDPEGTDLTWTLHEDYYTRSESLFNATPIWGHLLAHGVTPIVRHEDATGVVQGTTSHFSRPFPHIELRVEDGLVTKVSGGGRYGQAWSEMLEETRHLQYPDFPRPGLFWLQEVAIGTNPKVFRPSNIHLHSSGGFEIERRRSGIIHLGFGTFWQAPEEDWAAERGILYGHLHVHLLFPTLDVTTRSGRTIRLIDRGHLTALNDPEVRKLAGRYGDPEQVLKEDWIPRIPGISAPGSYEEYARDPVRWIYGPGVGAATE